MINNTTSKKIKISSIIEFIFMTMVICNCKGFYLLLPVKYQDIFVYFYYLCTILSFLFIFFFSRKDKQKYKIINRYLILCVLLFFIPQFIYTYQRYGLGIKSYISAINQYSFVVWSVPILYLLLKNDGCDKMINNISNIVLIGYISIIINVWLKNAFGFSFFNIEKWAYKNNSIRLLNLSSFMPIVLVYNWNRILNKQATPKNYLTWIIVLLVTIFIEQTRFQILAMAATLFMMYLFKKRNSQNKIMLYFITITVAIFTLFSGYLTNYVSQFSIENNGISTTYRIAELRYYLGQFKKNKVFGIGTIPLNDIYRIYHISSYGDMNPNDIGIFGALGVIGSGVLVLFILPMLKFSSICWKAMKSKKWQKEGLILFGILLYLTFSSITLFVLNFQRAPLFPFCIAIFEYYNMLLKNENISDGGD